MFRQKDKNTYAQLQTYASLTLVDGATIFDSGLNLIGFGAKVKMDPVELESLKVCIKNPQQIDTGGKTVPFSEYSSSHGTRHQSAISFCHQNPDSLAFVVSQDGHCSLIQSDRSTNIIDVVTPLFRRMSPINSTLADSLEIFQWPAPPKPPRCKGDNAFNSRQAQWSCLLTESVSGSVHTWPVLFHPLLCSTPNGVSAPFGKSDDPNRSAYYGAQLLTESVSGSANCWICERRSWAVLNS